MPPAATAAVAAAALLLALTTASDKAFDSTGGGALPLRCAASSCYSCQQTAGCAWCNDTSGRTPTSSGFCKPAATPADCVLVVPSQCRSDA
jgi:hypothetical protein